MTPTEIRGFLDAHAAWLGNRFLPRPNLRGASLRGANLGGASLGEADLGEASLRGADLRGASLWGADLRGATLGEANLRGASLWGADLRGANLGEADLREASLRGADLRGANLGGADLRGASLRGANLGEANLRGADLGEADLGGAKNVSPLAAAQTLITPDGAIIGWKKCRDGVVVQLRIPKEARRHNATARKCRAEYAVVLELHDPRGLASEAHDLHTGETVYRVGETVRPDRYEPDRWQECAGGIHFYLTREEAEAHT